VLKRSWADQVRDVSLLVAISVNADDYRQILGIVEGGKEGQGRLERLLGHFKEAASPASC
jgi:putative transposase